MTARRSRLEIMLDVLTAVQNGEKKPTRIMYAANLSWTPTQRILSSLVQQGLLSERVNTGGGRSKRRYEITEKGVEVLDYFEGSKEVLDVELVSHKYEALNC